MVADTGVEAERGPCRECTHEVGDDGELLAGGHRCVGVEQAPLGQSSAVQTDGGCQSVIGPQSGQQQRTHRRSFHVPANHDHPSAGRTGMAGMSNSSAAEHL